MIPSSRAVLSRDKRLPLDTWNQSGLQENVFENQISTFDSPKDYPQRIQSDDVQRNRESRPWSREGRRLVTQVKTDKIKAQFQCRQLQQGRWQRVLQYRWNYRRCALSDSKDSKKRNCNSTNSLIHNRFLGVENSIQNPSRYLFWFSIRCYVVDQRSGDGWFFGRVKILAISLWKGFSKLRDAGREDCLCSEQDHPEFPVQEEGIGFYEEDRSPSWSTTIVEGTGASGYSIKFSVTPHDDNIQEFDTRWDEVLSSMSKIPSDEILECLYKLRIRESDQLKTVFELYDMEIH